MLIYHPTSSACRARSVGFGARIADGRPLSYMVQVAGNTALGSVYQAAPGACYSRGDLYGYSIAPALSLPESLTNSMETSSVRTEPRLVL